MPNCNAPNFRADRSGNVGISAALVAPLAILSLGGFYLLPAHFLLWMGLVGGGFLIVSGLWLMRV